MDNKQICLLDISGFIYRAYYASPHMQYNGIEVGSLFGFCSEILKIYSIFNGSIFVAAMDCSRYTVRNEIYKEYKSNRKQMPNDLLQQLPLIHEVCEKFGFNNVKCDNYEADDIIASFVNHYSERKQLIVISADKDLLQLLNFNNTKVYNPVKHKYINDNDVIKMFGVTKDKILDILSLMGDKADNIPGAFGIGPKNASKLIQEYGSLENILQNCNNTKIKQSIDNIILSKKLIELQYNLNINYNINYKDPDKLEEYLKSFEFNSLIKRLNKINLSVI